MINTIFASLFDTDKIALYRQPIRASDQSNTVHGSAAPHYEVLCRFIDKHDKVHLPPGEFMEMLERHDIQEEIDKIIVSKTINWILKYDNQPDDCSKYHINISAKSVNSLPTILDRYPVTLYPRLSFEVTENSLVDISFSNLTRLNYIRNLGITLSFDDFGSKFICYGDLAVLKPDYIKIDGSFVKNCIHNTFNTCVIQNIINLAHCINAQVIAESVENQDIADYVTNLGADLLQGWHIGVLEEMKA